MGGKVMKDRSLRSIAVSSLLFAGIALAASPALAQVKLNFWSEFSSPPASTAINEIVADFNKANPDIQVTHTGFENTPYETTLKTAFGGGTPADIVEVNGGADMFQYAQADQLVDLTDFVEGISKNIKPGLDSTYRFHGKDWGIPLNLSIGNMLWYNKDMLKAQGIDPSELKTWDGFLAAMQKFKDAGITPLAFGDSEGWPGNHIYTHLLRRILSDQEYVDIALQSFDPSVTPKVTWNDPDAVKPWEMFKNLLNKGYFTAGYLADDEPTAEKLFLTGKAPLFTMGSWTAGDIKLMAPDGPFGVMLFPTVEGGRGTPDGLVINDVVLTVTKASKHPDAAKKFLAYIASEPAQKKFAEMTQSLISYTYDTSDWNYSDLTRQIAAIASASHSSAPFLDMLEDQSCNVPWIWQASQGILSGDLTPQEAGDGHQDCVEKLRKKLASQ
jgi:raffinose/stachyose/melibiose transport system substrate-binding protein